jgi:phosphotransferase system enzyme I (PtsI)
VRLTGVAAAPGFGVGPPLFVRTQLPAIPASYDDTPEAAAAGVHAALGAAREELDARALAATGPAAEILAAQAEMAADPELASAAAAAAAAGAHPAQAILDAGESFADALAASDSEYLAARANDVRDVARRASAWALGAPLAVISDPPEPVVIVADDLAPSDTAQLDPTKVLGLATQLGSRTSHTAILARALAVPAVVAVPGLTEHAAGAAVVAVDGDAGAVVLDPDAAELGAASAAAAAEGGSAAVPTASGARLRDGTPVELACNVGSAAELAGGLRHGIDGVGLLRTELAYLLRREPPTPEELRDELCELVELLGGRRLVVRTFDFGADKPVPFLGIRPGPNPALGVRGLRLARQATDLLAQQLAAVAEAARRGPVAVMAPMVATVDDAEWFAAQVRAVVGDGVDLEVGAMVEVPSAVHMASELAERLDFLSIGTNDLAQYLHAADRQEGALAALQDPFSPALLRAVDVVCRGARGAAWVGVCGEAAADPVWAAVALGLGVSELSMGAGAIPAVRAALAAASRADCQRAARAAIAADTAGAARAAAERALA